MSPQRPSPASPGAAPPTNAAPGGGNYGSVAGGDLRRLCPSASPGPARPRSGPPSPFLKKPIWVASSSSGGGAGGSSPAPGGTGTSHGGLRRHLTLFDLVCVGVGATVGSGIFVLCGLIARTYAGPATFASWAIAGLAACFSGLCYAELAGKFPTAGSSYAYAYVSMGELPAVIAGACLSLEYVFSASAVARSWGDKIVEYVRANGGGDRGGGAVRAVVLSVLDPGWGLNPMAFLVAAASVFLLLEGVKESKAVTNAFTVVKVGLVLFMCIGGWHLLDMSNLTPIVPPEFGISGIFRGATSSFFGYIGYDEICCMSGEAKNPAKNLPRAVIASLLIVTTLYMLAAVALTGMVPYQDISTTSGFPDGFRYRNWEAAAQITSLGELITLPLVVLVTIMAQPRLQYAMAVDGLLPPIFAHIDTSGNLWHGTLISGALMTIIATCVPFTYLDDLISAGILVAFSITDSSVVLLRQTSPDDRPHLLEGYLGLFHALSLVASLLLSHCMGSMIGIILAAGTCLSLVIIAYAIATTCPKSAVYSTAFITQVGGEGYFETPFVPLLPLLGTFINWYLIAQLEFLGLFLLVAYVAVAVLFYFWYGVKHSVGNTVGWDHIAEYEIVVGHEKAEGHHYQHKPLETNISIPRVRRGDPGYVPDESEADETRSI